MKLWYNKALKDPIYYIQIGFRNGKKVITKNVERIGKHSELLKITDDPLSYAKSRVALANEDAKSSVDEKLELSINLAEKISSSGDHVSKSTLKNVGYLYLQQLYFSLGIDKFFIEFSRDRKITFDIDEVNRFITYSRILSPDSKLGSFENLHSFYGDPSFDYQHIMRSMDFLYEHYQEYIEFLYHASNKVIKRNTSVCYYDCTNYYCETETADPDYVDPITGEVMTGIRQYGFPKDHKPNPIVEMGLFMDANGIPLSMCIKPGNTNEQTTVLPLEKDLVRMLGDTNNKFIYCADAGLSSYHIRNFNNMGGRSFIVTQSIKKLSGPLQTAVFNDCQYRLISNNQAVTIDSLKNFDTHDQKNLKLYNDFAYKVLEANNLIDVGLYEDVTLKNGNTKKVKSKASLKQNIIILFSRKSMEYQRHVRNAQIERAKKILEKMDPNEFKKGPNDVTRFIKKVANSKDTYILDQDRIAEEEKYDGYYAIATNLETKKIEDINEIFKISKQRNKIEECFRILKTDFVSRPIFHQTYPRIIAHFMICYTALLLFRILELKVNSFSKDLHFTVRNIIETLQSMQVGNLEDTLYIAQYTGSNTLNALEAAYPLGLNRKYYEPKTLNKKGRKNFFKKYLSEK